MAKDTQVVRRAGIFSMYIASMRGNFTDSLRILSAVTPGRAINAWRVYRSFRKSRRTGHAAINGMPVSISIEPTTSCNLRCPECPSGLRSFSRPTGMLKPALFQEVVSQLAPYTSYLTFYFQGEPYLNPNFLPMVEQAKMAGMYTATSTNGHYLDDERARDTIRSGLDRLIISVDGTDQDTYSAYRKGGKLDQVLDGAKNIMYWKKKMRSTTPYVLFQFLVVKPNEHQIPEIFSLGKNIGVDKVVLKSAQIYDHKHGSPLIPDNKRYSRYRLGGDGTYQIHADWDNHCWKMWHSCVITWDGDVLPCCFDKDGQYSMGNLRTNTFSSIWTSDSYNAFRQTLLHARKDIEMCRNCTEGMKIGI